MTNLPKQKNVVIWRGKYGILLQISFKIDIIKTRTLNEKMWIYNN